MWSATLLGTLVQTFKQPDADGTGQISRAFLVDPAYQCVEGYLLFFRSVFQGIPKNRLNRNGCAMTADGDGALYWNLIVHILDNKRMKGAE